MAAVELVAQSLIAELGWIQPKIRDVELYFDYTTTTLVGAQQNGSDPSGYQTFQYPLGGGIGLVYYIVQTIVDSNGTVLISGNESKIESSADSYTLFPGKNKDRTMSGLSLNTSPPSGIVDCHSSKIIICKGSIKITPPRDAFNSDSFTYMIRLLTIHP